MNTAMKASPARFPGPVFQSFFRRLIRRRTRSRLERKIAIGACLSLFTALARADTVGMTWTGQPGVTETVSHLMAREQQVAANGGPAQHPVKPLLKLDR